MTARVSPGPVRPSYRRARASKIRRGPIKEIKENNIWPKRCPKPPFGPRWVRLRQWWLYWLYMQSIKLKKASKVIKKRKKTYQDSRYSRCIWHVASLVVVIIGCQDGGHSGDTFSVWHGYGYTRRVCGYGYHGYGYRWAFPYPAPYPYPYPSNPYPWRRIRKSCHRPV